LFEDDIRRDYVHVDDVASVLLRAWHSGQPSGVYNLGSGVAISHRAIAEAVVGVARDAQLRLESEPIRVIPMPDQLRARFQFYTKAEGVLPWVAAITANSVDKMVRYWTEQTAGGERR